MLSLTASQPTAQSPIDYGRTESSNDQYQVQIKAQAWRPATAYGKTLAVPDAADSM